MKNLFRLIVCFLLISCSTEDDPSEPIVGGPTDPVEGGGGDDGGVTDDPLLYNASEDLNEIANFPIGNIVSASRLTASGSTNEAFRQVLLAEYDRITAENDMKMANIFTAPDTYDFSDADVIVDYAQEHGLRVHGHTLVWHRSIPGWLEDFAGTDEEFSALIEDYVKTTVAHFAEETVVIDGEEVPVISGWDVVNEAFEGPGYRNSIFREKIGNDYVAKLFQWAREADADVPLFYNDYNIAGEPSKRNAILNMVQGFQENDIPIDGIGMQMHLNYNWPTDDLPAAIEEIADSGLLVHVSELDVKANPNDDISELTEERALAQEDQFQRAAYYYSQLVPEDQQYGLTIWGFRDRDSWLYENGSDWPLLYDADFNTKIAHRGLAAGLSGESPE